MDRGDVDKVLEAAGAQFEAAIAAEEDAAAADLALSLLQGSEIAVLLTRGAWKLRRPHGATATVTHVGPDVVMAASRERADPDVVAPLASAMFVAGEGGAPARVPDTFVSILRRSVRAEGRLRITLGDEPLDGRARIVTDSHVVIARSGGHAVVPLGAIREVQLLG